MKMFKVIGKLFFAAFVVGVPAPDFDSIVQLFYFRRICRQQNVPRRGTGEKPIYCQHPYRYGNPPHIPLASRWYQRRKNSCLQGNRRRYSMENAGKRRQHTISIPDTKTKAVFRASDNAVWTPDFDFDYRLFAAVVYNQVHALIVSCSWFYTVVPNSIYNRLKKQDSDLIYEYTSGYPYLISRLCSLMDERIPGTDQFPSKNSVWTEAGFYHCFLFLILHCSSQFHL